ncbi:MAG: sigma-70 family RNA polymerase sigma factor [Flavobacteriaceae bacterium]|nr:sigma-70 family RNA polymerase sigma factor [Flavobacteriaceae bacterium]MCY4217376.1 sigma-70 family RNA polymerase sigma factor [Flavobacteriaceae bacterium]
MSIEELVLLGKNKDQKAYHELFRRFWKPVYHFLLKRTNDEHDAELLSIEVFTKAFDKLTSFDLKYQFENWLFTIARNHHIDHTRKIVKQQDLHADLTAQQLFNVPSEVPTIEDDLILKEKLELVLSHLDKLNDEQRALMEAFYMDDHSLKYISEKFNLPINTVKVKIFRSRKRLLKLLEDAPD